MDCLPLTLLSERQGIVQFDWFFRYLQHTATIQTWLAEDKPNDDTLIAGDAAVMYYLLYHHV